MHTCLPTYYYMYSSSRSGSRMVETTTAVFDTPRWFPPFRGDINKRLEGLDG